MISVMEAEALAGDIWRAVTMYAKEPEDWITEVEILRWLGAHHLPLLVDEERYRALRLTWETGALLGVISLVRSGT